MLRLDNEESKVCILLVLLLPIFQWVHIAFLVHVLARFTQLLVMYYVYVWALLVQLSDFPGYLFKTFVYQCLVLIFIKPINQQLNLLILQKVLNMIMRLLPLALTGSLKDDPFLAVGDKNCIAELLVLHALEQGDIADCGFEGVDFYFLLYFEFIAWFVVHFLGEFNFINN